MKFVIKFITRMIMRFFSDNKVFDNICDKPTDTNENQNIEK